MNRQEIEAENKRRSDAALKQNVANVAAGVIIVVGLLALVLGMIALGMFTVML